MPFPPAYIPLPPPRTPPISQQRVAISPQSHKRLSLLASKRFRGNGSVSKLGTVILDQYLSHIERVYFGAPRATSVIPVPSSHRDHDAVLFDMDGVLCDSEIASRQAAVATLKQLYDIDCQSDDFAPFTGTGEVNFLAGVANLYNVNSFDPQIAKHTFFDIYTRRLFTNQLTPFPGVVNLVNRIKQIGLKVAVASSADMIKVETNLQAIGLPSTTFDFITSSDSIKNKKPAPDVFLAAAKGLQVSPERCIVIEDAVSGVQAAKTANMRCVAVATTLNEHDLRAAGADIVRSEPALIQLIDLFGRDVFAQLQPE